MGMISQVRLLPIVLFAIGALLLLKVIGGLTSQTIISAGPPAALAASGKAAPPPAAPPPAAAPPKEQSEPPLPQRSSEGAINDRLGDRRRQLDERAKELDQREALLKASEKKLDERVDELKRIEQRIDSAVTARQDEKSGQYKSLVTMYESMKPKDAARILDKLDLDVTLELVTRMNARKTSEILAEMTAEAAQRLTVALARRGSGPSVSSPVPGSDAGAPQAVRELPRVESNRPGG